MSESHSMHCHYERPRLARGICFSVIETHGCPVLAFFWLGRGRYTPQVVGVIIFTLGTIPIRSRFLPVHGRVPHTFAVFECVGDHESIGDNLAATGRYDNSFPLIPTSGMSGAPGGIPKGNVFVREIRRSYQQATASVPRIIVFSVLLLCMVVEACLTALDWHR